MKCIVAAVCLQLHLTLCETGHGSMVHAMMPLWQHDAPSPLASPCTMAQLQQHGALSSLESPCAAAPRNVNSRKMWIVLWSHREYSCCQEQKKWWCTQISREFTFTPVSDENCAICGNLQKHDVNGTFKQVTGSCTESPPFGYGSFHLGGSNSFLVQPLGLLWYTLEFEYPIDF